MELRQKKVHLGASDKLMELFTTHPNMLKRIRTVIYSYHLMPIIRLGYFCINVLDGVYLCQHQ